MLTQLQTNDTPEDKKAAEPAKGVQSTTLRPTAPEFNPQSSA